MKERQLLRLIILNERLRKSASINGIKPEDQISAIDSAARYYNCFVRQKSKIHRHLFASRNLRD
jgi:hypothetical protein